MNILYINNPGGSASYKTLLFMLIIRYACNNRRCVNVEYLLFERYLPTQLQPVKT